MQKVICGQGGIFRWAVLFALAGGLSFHPANVFAADEISPALQFAKQLNQAFIEVADKVSPSVVVITVTRPDTGDEDDPFGLPPQQPGKTKPGGRDSDKNRGGHPRVPMALASGSGIVISEDGYIVTNDHVVDQAQRISVVFKDGRRFKARIRGVDPVSDLAVIKIDATGLKAAAWADSEAARVGEFVLAVGAPFDLDYTVTVGHISAKGRSFEAMTGTYVDQDFVQTDASINPGNSGGPLVNLDGQVVGINAMIRGLHTGIGFAIPSNLAKRVVPRLIADGKYTRSWLGVGIGNLRDDPYFKSMVTGVEDGVLIREIVPGSPASKSTLRPADVVLAVDGKTVKTSRELKEEISYKPIGKSVSLDVLREGKMIQVPVVTEGLPETDGTVVAEATKPESTQTEMGLTVRNLTKELAEEFNLEQKKGVVVTDIEPDSPADLASIRPGDLITDVGKKPVRNVKEFRQELKAADLKKGVVINLLGEGGVMRFSVLKESGD